MFRKLEFEIADDVVKSIVESQQWAIEHFLMMLRRKIERYVFEQKRAKQRPQDGTKTNDRPEVDQDFKGQIYYLFGNTRTSMRPTGATCSRINCSSTMLYYDCLLILLCSHL